MSPSRLQIAYANVMATVAVFIALGGTGYAVMKLPNASVGAKQLKKSAVTTAKIKKEAVTATKIKKGTLTGAQIDVSTLSTVPSAAVADRATSSVQAGSADNADTLDGLDSAGYAKSVASGSFTYDPPSLAAGACVDAKDVQVPHVESSDVIVVTPHYESGFVYTFQLSALLRSGDPGYVEILACNNGAGTLDQASIGINWRLLR